MSLLRQHVAGVQAANAFGFGINDAAAASNQMCGASNPASGNFHCPDLGGSRLTESSSRFYFWNFSVSLFEDPAWCHGRAALSGGGLG
jgi:hypothetical protein